MGATDPLLLSVAFRIRGRARFANRLISFADKTITRTLVTGLSLVESDTFSDSLATMEAVDDAGTAGETDCDTEGIMFTMEDSNLEGSMVFGLGLLSVVISDTVKKLSFLSLLDPIDSSGTIVLFSEGTEEGIRDGRLLLDDKGFDLVTDRTTGT